jgi:hypothetical protein
LDLSAPLSPGVGILGKPRLAARFTVRDLAGGQDALVRVRLIHANLPGGKPTVLSSPALVGTPQLVEKTFLILPLSSPYPPKCARVIFVYKMEISEMEAPRTTRRHLRGIAVHDGISSGWGVRNASPANRAAGLTGTTTGMRTSVGPAKDLNRLVRGGSCLKSWKTCAQLKTRKN